MRNEDNDNIVFLIIIAGRKQKDALLSELHKSNVHLTSTIYGKGTVKASYLKNILGLVPEENKAVITCLTSRAKADAVLTRLIEEFNFDKPNTGMAFSFPVERVSF